MGNVIRRIQCSFVLYKNCFPPALMHNKWVGVGIFCRHPQKGKNPADAQGECCSFQGVATAAVISAQLPQTLSLERKCGFLWGMRSQPDPSPKTRHSGDDLTDIPHSSSCLAPDAREGKRETLPVPLQPLLDFFFHWWASLQGFAQAF